MGHIAGTAHYLSPEQVLGRPAGPQADLFAVGVLLYELSTGVRPFDGPTDGAVFDAILHTAPHPPARFRPELSAGLGNLILRLLEKDADVRFQSAEDLRAALAGLGRGSQGSQPSVTEPIPRPVRGTGLWPMLGATAGAAAVAAFVTWLVFRPTAPQPRAVPISFELQSHELGEDLFPSLSPDGKQFVFASERNGNLDIYLRRAGGAVTVNLTVDHKGADTTPAFSRDGARIAFRSERGGGGLFVMEATGENPRRIARRGYYPSWGPGNVQIAASTFDFSSPSRRRHGSQILIADVATGQERLLPGTTDAIQPAWSPHGQRIAYWGLVDNTSRRDLFTIPADGSGPPLAVTTDAALD